MIDRKKVIKDLEDCLSSSCRGYRPRLLCPYSDEEWDIMRDALTLLKEQEAKTGQWIYESEFADCWSNTCSECGKRFTNAIESFAPYCWNCGAKMKG